MANLIKGPLSARPVDAPVGTLFWDENTNITYVYYDATWSVYPGSGRGNWATKTELDAAVASLTARIAELKGAVNVTVTFNTDGGSTAPDPQTILYNTVASAPADPTKASKVFAGWFLPDATTAFVFTTKVKKNITLTAHWADPAVTTTRSRAKKAQED